MSEASFEAASTTGYFPDFDLDLAFGHVGERYVYDAVKALAEGRVEVKRERYANGRIFVEVGQNPRGMGWRRSGIMVTKAEFYAYVKPGGTILFFRTDAVMAHIEERYAAGEQPREVKVFSDNPAKGYVIEVADILNEGRDV